jgi:hypothetical protein
LRDFNDSTLWRISAYERMRAETGTSGFARLDSTTVLTTTLTAELARLGHAHRSTDTLEVLAACIRRRENALLLLRHNGLVWPLTLFPQRHLYHLPRPIVESLEESARDLELVALEPPGIRPPLDTMQPLAEDGPGYRALAPLLWALALHVPYANLLEDIGGRAAYRLTAEFTPTRSAQAGALGPALQRLRSEIASLPDIARWPGMDRERATRLLNGIYLQGGLMVLRTHHAARDSGSGRERLRGWFRQGR